MNRIADEYFEWMVEMVSDETYLSYRKLLCYLHDIEFIYILPMDGNRAQDGIDFRYRFGYENGYSRDQIKKYLDVRPCSIFEMMVALAFDAEEHIMDDDSYGNRTGQWFWTMIVSLGLGRMDDTHFNRRYVDQVIDDFLNRNYEPNGKGGLFTVQNPPMDMRDTEIWYQFMWYLNEILEI